jgi:hypothetical protein
MGAIGRQSGDVQEIGLRFVTVVAGFLLFSMGGAAIFAAPVSVPLLIVALRSERIGRRWNLAAGSVMGLTIGQCAFVAVFAVQGDAQPLVWLVPVAAIIGTWAIAARALR